MPVRGKRSIYPKAPLPPTGMFKSPQKQDSTANFDEKGTQAYAHRHDRKRGAMGNRLVKDNKGQSLRSQGKSGLL